MAREVTLIPGDGPAGEDVYEEEGTPFPERTPAEAPPEAQELVRAFESTAGAALLAQPPLFQGTFGVVPAHS